MPEELKWEIFNSFQSHSAYALGENLTATCPDLARHNMPLSQIPAADKIGEFEIEALQGIGLYNVQTPSRYFTSHFNYMRGGGCTAGYYSYL